MRLARVLSALILVLLAAISAHAVPPTPTNTPAAHPLAPNPHTSVGVFWIYTDPNTGRQWTGGTYKVKRCTGASCTPTAEVATGLTSADFQDTGLSSNTTYGYSYLANDGADSGDSPVVYVTTLSADSNLAQFPSTTWANVLGPLPEAAQIPFSWYNSVATSQGQEMIAKFPVVAPSTLQGTGAISNGGNVLTGTGTRFLEQVAANNPACLDAISIAGVNAGAIASVDSNTQITLVSNWTGSTQSGVALSTNVSGLCGYGDPLSDYITGNQLGYYDSPMALWALYFRTGDPQYMRGAIKFSEAVFAGYMWLGRNRAWSQFSTTPNSDNMPPPRNFQFHGYLLLGLAGHNGVWDLLDNYLTNRYAVWLSNYRGGDNNFLYMREKGYFILFTTLFVMAAPDSFPRSDGTVTSLNGGTTVDGDLTDGRKDHWRDQLDIDVPGFVLDDQTAAGEWYEQSWGDYAGEVTMPYPPGTVQPWIMGIVVDALGFCWRNTELSSTARDAARKMVLRSSAYLALRAYNTNIAADDTSHRWNYTWYFSGGGTGLNPYAFGHGSDSSILNNTPDNNMIAQYRQSNPFLLAPLGWAWEMSGQSVYKTWGEGIANAAFAEIGENTGGTGDGIKSLCDSDANYKDYGQCYRSSPRFFANRLSSPSSLGTPPSVTMPSNQTLTSGVNQATLTAAVTCVNAPCAHRWFLVEYPMLLPRQATHPVFSADTSLTTTLSGLEAGVYKVGFYTLDSLGLVGSGTVNVTVGDGIFPPVVAIHRSGLLWACTTSTSLSNIHVRAYSAAGRSLTHAFSISKPKDASAPTVTPSGTTGNFITVSVTGLTSTSSSWYLLKDVVTDSAGASRTAYFGINVHSTCGTFAQPSAGHNTIPSLAKTPDHILPPTATATVLYVAPVDPEGSSQFTTSAAGYIQNGDGAWVMGPLTHSWSQVAGPVNATITNGTTVRPTVTGLTQAGTYTFRYTGIDPQGDSAVTDINVTVRPLVTVTVYQANLQHGTYTNGNFDPVGQADILGTADVDVVAANEVSVGDVGNWDDAFTDNGMTRAIFDTHLGSPGDGNALWYRTSTTSLLQTYSHDLANGPSNTGWNGQDVRRNVVAGKFSKGGAQFYVVAFHACAALCEDSSNTNFAAQRVAQIEDLLSWINSTLTGGLPVIIPGDYNLPPNYPRAPERSYTADSSTDVITSTAHGWTAGTAVSLRTTGSAPGNLATGDSLYAQATVYYLRDVTTNTFKLAASPGGGVIDLTSNGTGSNFVSATQWDLFTQSYTDLWFQGLGDGRSTANWGDRDSDSVPDQPATFQTTRTHDSRRIDYVMVKGGASLVSIDMPDLRATCSVALTTGGNYMQCPDVQSAQLTDFPDDQGVRPSDHNFLKAVVTLDLASAVCNWHTSTRCQ